MHGNIKDDRKCDTNREGEYKQHTHTPDICSARETRVNLVSEVKTKGFGVFLVFGGNSFHTSGKWQDTFSPSHAFLLQLLSFQLSWDLGKDLNQVRLSMLKEQTSAGLASGCGLLRALQTQKCLLLLP